MMVPGPEYFRSFKFMQFLFESHRILMRRGMTADTGMKL